MSEETQKLISELEARANDWRPLDPGTAAEIADKRKQLIWSKAASALSTLLEENKKLREALGASKTYIDDIPRQHSEPFKLIMKRIDAALSPDTEKKNDTA